MNCNNRTRDEDEFAKVVSSYLWFRYEYMLPEAPGYVAQNLIDLLNKNGLTITTIKGDEMEKTLDIQLQERGEAIAQAIEKAHADLRCPQVAVAVCSCEMAAHIARTRP